MIPVQIGHATHGGQTTLNQEVTDRSDMPPCSRPAAAAGLDDAYARTPARVHAFIRNNCMRCPIRAACGAAGANEWYGVWGGVPAYDRIKLFVQDMSARQRREQMPEILDALFSGGATDEDVAETFGKGLEWARRMRSHALREELLPEVLELAKAGFTQGQIATKLDIPVGRVKSWKRRWLKDAA